MLSFVLKKKKKQLNTHQVLAEREKRLGSDSVTSSTDELNEKSKDDPAHHLLEEIRQAVSEANAKGTPK